MGTVATQVGTLALSAIVLPMAARQWSPAEFGRYSVTYRLLALMQPALTMSASVSVTRYLARLKRSDRQAISSVLFGASRLLVLPIGLAVLLLTTLAHRVAPLAFGESGQDRLVVALSLLLAGSTAYSIVASTLQGIFRVAWANTLILICVGVAPLVGILLWDTPASVLAFTAAVWLLVSVVYACPLLARPDRRLSRSASAAIFRFGYRRIPGELAFFGLLSLPPVLVVQTQGIRDAGFVSLAMSLVTLCGSLCTPLSTVMLPYLSAEFVGTNQHHVRQLRVLLVGASGLIVLGSIALLGALPMLVRGAFGRNYVDAIAQMRLACVAIPAYGSYVVCRSVLDAYYERAVTMWYAVLAFTTFVIGYAVLRAGTSDDAELIAFSLGMWTLGGLTVARTLRLLGSLLTKDRDVPGSCPDKAES